jgi:hypothetical protein
MILPGTRGMLAFGCMIANGALLLLLRSTSTALLLMTGWGYCVAYYAGDHALNFAQKALRNDFALAMHLGDGFFTEYVMGPLVTVIYKMTVDFTGLVDWRNPFVLGGVYWTSSMVRAGGGF